MHAHVHAAGARAGPPAAWCRRGGVLCLAAARFNRSEASRVQISRRRQSTMAVGLRHSARGAGAALDRHSQQLRGHAATSSVVSVPRPASLVRVLLAVLCTCVSWADAADDVQSFVKADLRRYDGSDDTLPILMAIRGVVFDVSTGANFYSRAAPYNQLAGRDCSLAVGLMSLEQADLDAEDDISSLDEHGMDDLNTVFYETYVRKYPIIGLATDSRAIPAGKEGADWLAEVKAKQQEAGGPSTPQQSKDGL